MQCRPGLAEWQTIVFGFPENNFNNKQVSSSQTLILSLDRIKGLRVSVTSQSQCLRMSSCCPDNSLDCETPYDGYFWHSKGVVDEVRRVCSTQASSHLVLFTPGGRHEGLQSGIWAQVYHLVLRYLRLPGGSTALVKGSLYFYLKKLTPALIFWTQVCFSNSSSPKKP